jgi:hypothetical protein
MFFSRKKNPVIKGQWLEKERFFGEISQGAAFCIHNLP